MRELRITPWRIESLDPDDRSFRESIFSQGNGYMGTRGYRPDQRGAHPAWRSTFLAGFYEYVKPGITDLVNHPDFSGIQFRLNGTDSESHTVSDFLQTLDLRCGLVTWAYILTDRAGNQTRVKQEKFLSMADRHLAAIRVSLTPVNWSGTLELSGGIDARVENLPVSDDQLTENVEFVKMWSDVRTEPRPAGGQLTAQTRISHRQIAQSYLFSGKGSLKTEAADEWVTTTINARLSQGMTWVGEKRIAVASFRDGDAGEIVKEKSEELKDTTFDELLTESALAWEKIWKQADVQLIGNDEWQGAIRYNIFQLIQAMPYGDTHASIGARGLTHGRYKGCYFWDTEIFMLPFFAYTQPNAAKSLLQYRCHTLPDAVESAKRFSAKGARFSWMASDTGFEQCGTWDTGCCEIHITADIAHAVRQYVELTGDEAFLRDCGTELLLQTARYWVDRFNYVSAEDQYHLLFVKGPDEYCGVTCDDFYTVSMARDHLEQAAAAVKWMEKTYPEDWAVLAEKTGFQPEETEKWKDIAAKVVLRRRGELWKQDATFDLLEPLDIQAHKDDDAPLYHKIGFDRLQRYQVLKQPAVLMYMALCPEKFSKDEVEAAWNYYEPKTLHDSTLSFGIHALVAARLGYEEKAVHYLEKSLFLDLKNVMKNTAGEGIHTASLGATWQAMVLGFGGLSIRNGVLNVENRLPPGIEEMRYRVCHKGIPHQITIRKNQKPEIFVEI